MRTGAAIATLREMSIAELLATNATAGPDPCERWAVSAVGLSKTYAGASRPAIRGLDMSVAAGEILGLLGPNGAGKTTTIGMLTTRFRPTSGSATILGTDLVRAPVAVRRLIGVVSQNNTLDRQLTVSENLCYHGLLFGCSTAAARAAARGMLGAFDLADVANAPVAALSGGMARRLMIARAIMHAPAVLFLDEPTIGLDPVSRRQIWELLGQLRRDGLTIVLSTHHMEEADRVCDRVAILHRGELAALDTPVALKQSVGGGIATVVTDGPASHLAAELSKRTSAMFVRSLGDRVEVHAPTTRGLAESVVGAAASARAQIVTISVAQPSLEDAFLSLTGAELAE
jgi:ABC-2 type transport system ATP-binding protein